MPDVDGVLSRDMSTEWTAAVGTIGFRGCGYEQGPRWKISALDRC